MCYSLCIHGLLFSYSEEHACNYVLWPTFAPLFQHRKCFDDEINYEVNSEHDSALVEVPLVVTIIVIIVAITIAIGVVIGIISQSLSFVIFI